MLDAAKACAPLEATLLVRRHVAFTVDPSLVHDGARLVGVCCEICCVWQRDSTISITTPPRIQISAFLCLLLLMLLMFVYPESYYWGYRLVTNWINISQTLNLALLCAPFARQRDPLLMFLKSPFCHYNFIRRCSHAVLIFSMSGPMICVLGLPGGDLVAAQHIAISHLTAIRLWIYTLLTCVDCSIPGKRGYKFVIVRDKLPKLLIHRGSMEEQSTWGSWLVK